MAKEKKRKVNPWVAKMKEQFIEDYGGKTDRELQEEILFELMRLRIVSNKNRENTSNIVTWGIILPYILGAIGIIIWVISNSF